MQYLIPERFDLLAKYIYVKYQDLGVETSFHRNLYDEHIRVFNGGWEFPGTKTTIDEFRYTFDELIKSLKIHGFDTTVSVIPIGKNGIPYNGAHRIAACIWFQLEVKTRLLKNRPGSVYDWQFFQTYQLHVPHGLRTEFTDVMALQYALLKSDSCRMIVVFPKALEEERDLQAFEGELKAFGKIVYKNSLELTSNGLINLIEECYYREPWIGDDYHGVKAKFKLCWAQRLRVQAYLFEPQDPGLVRLIKTRLRKHFSAGQHALHINDTPVETVRIAKAILNDNSVHWLNHAKMTRHQWKGNDRLVFQFSKLLLDNYSFDEAERFLVDGSMVLSVYGLREANDLDYIHFGSAMEHQSQLQIQSHNHEWPKTAIDDLIFNPKNYFYAHGVKFLTPKALLEFKQNRGEPKDQFDITLLKDILPKVNH